MLFVLTDAQTHRRESESYGGELQIHGGEFATGQVRLCFLDIYIIQYRFDMFAQTEAGPCRGDIVDTLMYITSGEPTFSSYLNLH